MASGAPVLSWSVHRGWSALPWCSCRFLSVPGVEVDDAQECSRRRCFVMCPCLVAMSSHVKVNVNGLACNTPYYGNPNQSHY
jgi:hypothetical protein